MITHGDAEQRIASWLQATPDANAQRVLADALELSRHAPQARGLRSRLRATTMVPLTAAAALAIVGVLVGVGFPRTAVPPVSGIMKNAPSPRLATSPGSRFLIVPAAVFLGFANSGSPASSCARFNRANAARGKYTSPRTSMRCAGPSRKARGIARIARTFAVTSSPRLPSPRVAPRTSKPFSKVNARLRPSIFNSATY